MSYPISWDPITGKVIERHEEDEMSDLTSGIVNIIDEWLLKQHNKIAKEFFEAGIKYENERIIKLLEEQDNPLMKKLMAVESNTWESHSIAGQRMGFLMAIALIKGEQPVGNTDKL